MSEDAGNPRYVLLDAARGLCVVGMVVYHAFYDAAVFLHASLPWYRGAAGRVWEQSVCWTFVLLSGMCWNLSRRHIPRAVILLLCGAAVSWVTELVVPGEAIRYGVLTCLGLCAILLYLLDLLRERLCLRVPDWLGLLVSAALFFLCREVPHGYLGFESLRLCELPSWLYQSDSLAVLGFHTPSFYSADYFPLIPWFFLYLTGFFLWRCLSRSNPVKNFLLGPKSKPGKALCRPFAFLGRHSLLVYLLHQPALMLIFLLLPS